MNTPRRVFLVAIEESGDRLGAALMQALRERSAGAIEFMGVGGHAMAGQGLASLFPTEELAIIGFDAVVRKLPLILRRLRETAAAVLAARPDVLVIIDSPDFTHRVARRVRAADASIPIVNYVPPSVWAWRPWRARSMRAYVDHAMALLPFEPQVHRALGGPPCSYVGHPLTERLASLRPNPEEARRRLADPPVVLVLPGSRGSEIARLGDIFGAALGLLQSQAGPLELVLPTVPAMAERVRAAVAAWPVQPRIAVDPAEKDAAYRIARAALAKSGTVTLELALAGVPMVAAYRVSRIEAAIARRAIRVPSVILANLVLGENIVPEFLQQDCTPERLSEALAQLLQDSPARARQVEGFSKLDAIMDVSAARPAARAADIVLATARGP